jgi:formylglycine-generating enzyme required for sulfatase activity
VSWRDAEAYANWVSRKTGKSYRLPTDAEWAFAAGGRFHDEGWPDIDGSDPAKRWLARYEAESEQDPVDKMPRTIGSFGANEHGLLDIAGNVWEWTNTCFVRVEVAHSGEQTVSTTNCGVRVVEGRHRTYVTDFIRDARSGGCAIGTPPANLGFRMVKGD